MDGARGPYAKCHKSDRERQCMISLTCGISEQNTTALKTHINGRMVVAKGGALGELGRCWSKGKKFQL